MGCAASTPDAVQPVSHSLPTFAFGIWGKAELDVRDDCPGTGAASVRVTTTWATLLLSVVTIGVYTPRVVRVTCRHRP